MAMVSSRFRAGRAAIAGACLILAASTGCVGIKARETFLKNAVRDRVEVARSDRAIADPVAALLGRFGLLDLAGRDPAAAASILETRLATRPEADGSLAMADLSHRAGLDRQDREPEQALAWFRDAAALAAMSLGDPGTTRPDLAVSIHNRAVARLIRVAQRESRKGHREWADILTEAGIALESSTPDLAPRRFSDLIPVEDVRVSGMAHIYRNDGLGVSLVAHRRVENDDSPDPLDRFHPRELRSAATAIVTPSGTLAAGDWRKNLVTLSLFDPYQDRLIRLGEREWTIAGDRTTPRAIQVVQGHLPTLEFTGLFDSDFRRPGYSAGLYLFRPYEPGKIPVVLVHGLFSSPRAFLQTMNELENDPEVAARYQFWVFLYPTGQPIPASALELRNSLTKVRDTLDPDHADSALDRMVLVGHSMGGLLSKMMVQDSGLTLWDAAFRRSASELRASPATRKLLDDSLVFQPLPFVSRVVFIATPHRGSPIADQWFGRTVASFIRRSDISSQVIREVVDLNGPDMIAPEFRRVPLNGISNLRTDSPILKALVQIPIDPRVPHHSIIPKIGGVLPTDGVVEYRSSHIEGVVSEKIVAGTHSSQQHPDVIEELRRILALHLESL